MNAFFAMGGYAFYVWGSFAMCALGFACETILLIRRQNRLLMELKNEPPNKNLRPTP